MNINNNTSPFVSITWHQKEPLGCVAYSHYPHNDSYGKCIYGCCLPFSFVTKPFSILQTVIKSQRVFPSKHLSWWRRTEDIWKTSMVQHFLSSKTSSRRLLFKDVFKTLSRHFQDIIARRLQDLLQDEKLLRWKRLGKQEMFAGLCHHLFEHGESLYLSSQKNFWPNFHQGNWKADYLKKI